MIATCLELGSPLGATNERLIGFPQCRRRLAHLPANRAAARDARAAPVYRGDPGCVAHLDRDNDGVGCE
ncbi:MAG: excalibur calcium-binding domain-containing protein [Pseudomonadota bacterium]